MLQIIDRTARVPEPTAVPSLPYRVETHRYGPGEGVERLTKIYPNGLAELLTPDEVAIWGRVGWLKAELARRKGEVAAAEHDPANPPPLPYEAKAFKYGVGEGVEILTKVRPGDYSGEGLTPDEIGVWEYMSRLQAELGVTIPIASPISNTGDPAQEEVLVVAASTTATNSVAPTNAVPGDEVTAPGASNTEGTLTKRQHAERALLETPNDNNCVLAERLGVSDELIRKVRKELESVGRLQPLATITKRDGTSYALTGDAVGGEPATG